MPQVREHQILRVHRRVAANDGRRRVPVLLRQASQQVPIEVLLLFITIVIIFVIIIFSYIYIYII